MSARDASSVGCWCPDILFFG